MSDIVRVIRIYEFVGPREAVELQLQRSIQSERDSIVSGSDPNRPGSHRNFGTVKIRAATLGTFPEILEQSKDTSTEVSNSLEGREK